MQPFIANTDKRWFDFLGARGDVDEVNFWSPQAKMPLKRMKPGTPVFFRLKRPHYAIAGYGFFAHFALIDLDDAWDLFKWKNGDPDRLSFLRRIGEYRSIDLLDPRSERAPIGCNVLRDARFWPRERWIPWGKDVGWSGNVVRGSTERDPVRARLLLQTIAEDGLDAPEEFSGRFTPINVDHRQIVEREVAVRQGQGAFRLRLLDAYGRCAITGERTEPVLDAAHIQPYLGPGSNHVQNGLLLTKEFHALYDRGYVGVTPDYEIKVSPRLREEWQNGKRFYAYDGQQLARLPEKEAHRPSRDALQWHLERVFREAS